MGKDRLMNNPKRLDALDFTAHVGSTQDFWGLLFAYEESVNVLFGAIATDNMPPDIVSLPLLFLMRHSLELGYKATLDHLHKLGGKKYDPEPHGHRLQLLHKDLRKDFLKYCNPTPSELAEFDDYYEKTGKCMSLLDSLDAPGTRFRYPKDSHSDERLSLLETKNSFDAALILLKTTADVFPDPSEYM
jgi:hypothetical protein